MTTNASKNIILNYSKKLLIVYCDNLMFWKNSAKNIRSSCPNVWTVKIRWGCLQRKFLSLSRTTDCRGWWSNLYPQRTIYNPVKRL